MKAVYATRTGSPEVLKIKETDIPAIASHQVLIKVHAISVNFADIKARQGQYHGVTADEPFIPGLDCAGEVEEVGSEVTRFRKGQRVMAFPSGGSYAEYVVADEKLTFPVPDGMDMETAAASLTVGITSYNVIHKMARFSEGETILIHAAAGGIGSTAIQLAKLAGASKIIGTTSSEEKAKIALDFGADYIINYKEQSFVEEVKALTDGKGVDVILDTVAGENFNNSLKCLAPFGRIITFGHANEGSLPGTVQTTDLHSSCRSVIGYSTGTYRNQRPEFLEEGAAKVTELISNGELKIHISQRFSLEDAAKAHELLESRRSTGKVILLP